MRISGGDARGIRLRVPPGARPASERVRHAVFSSLGAAVLQARVLDLYCGSGAYGLEALSRGAEAAVFVDRDPQALRAARENARAAGLEAGCRFRRREVVGYLRGAREGPFDLVFLDPPYGDPGELERALDALGGVVAEGGRVVVEARRGGALHPPRGFVLEADRRYGGTRVLLLRRAGPMTEDG